MSIPLCEGASQLMSVSEHDNRCRGYCAECGDEHILSAFEAEVYCLELMRLLQRKKRIDLSMPDNEADPLFSTAYLFGEARGQMFGVLVCRDEKGRETVLKAFSGQYNGVWEVEGWVPPLLGVHEFHTVNHVREKEIKGLTKLIESAAILPEQKETLADKRKHLSQQLMKDIHALYSLTNFRGETRGLVEVFKGGKGIPAGTGDCCAPKLLNHAAKNALIPLALAEFYWGTENRSKTRKQGYFYGSCGDKCAPILGFMLCGLGGNK